MQEFEDLLEIAEISETKEFAYFMPGGFVKSKVSMQFGDVAEYGELVEIGELREYPESKIWKIY